MPWARGRRNRIKGRQKMEITGWDEKYLEKGRLILNVQMVKILGKWLGLSFGVKDLPQFKETYSGHG